MLCLPPKPTSLTPRCPKDDPRYKLLRNWVGDSLVAVEPKYDINYSPGGGPAPAPGATGSP